MRFSVVIPSYNSAATLGRAIDSVAEQTFAAHEIIVVDDGSTDETPAVVRSYGSRVTYLRQTNAGVAAARNAGASAAAGDWLAFLDADDWYAPDRLRLHAEWIATDSTLDLLTGDYEYRNEQGRLLGTSMPRHVAGRMLLSRAAGSTRLTLDNEREIEWFIADHFGDTHTLSVPRAAFAALGGYPVGFRVCEDVHLLVRLVARSRRIGVVAEPLATYLIHGDSATRRDRLAAQRENVRTLIDLFAYARQFPRPVRRGLVRRMQAARYDLACALVRERERGAAMRAVLPSLSEAPGWESMRNLLSVLRGTA